MCSIWHQRLGHPSINVLKHISFIENQIDGFDDHCDICPLAKQQRLPFLPSKIQTSHIFQIIHVDIWGPYKQQSISGGNYVLTIVDYFSRATWTFLMQHKTQVARLLDTFCKMVQNQFKTSVQTVRSDNGAEFFE